MKISGTILNRSSSDPRDRVFAVGTDRTFIGETGVDTDDRWLLDIDEPADWIIGQLSGTRLAATAIRPGGTMDIEMPQLHQVEFHFKTIFEGAMFWVDPLELDEFPDDILWSLRSHNDKRIDLHLGEFPAKQGGIRLALQSGKYRIGGGRFALRPVTAPEDRDLRLSQAVDQTTGAVLEEVNGEIPIAIRGNARFQLVLSQHDGN